MTLKILAIVFQCLILISIELFKNAKLSLLQLKKVDKELLSCMPLPRASDMSHMTSCDMTSCHMCLGLCCGWVVVSMETGHNFEHNTYITVGKKEHCWNSIIRKKMSIIRKTLPTMHGHWAYASIMGPNSHVWCLQLGLQEMGNHKVDMCLL